VFNPRFTDYMPINPSKNFNQLRAVLILNKNSQYY